VIKTIYNAGPAVAGEFHGIGGRMIAAEAATICYEIGELGRTGEGGLLRR